MTYKVTGWTDWDDERFDGEEYDKKGLYAAPELMTAIISELRNKGYKFTGDYHQHGDYGVPIINNKFLFKESTRRWGSIMAYALEIEGEYPYIQWAWNPREGQIYPNPDDY